MPIGIAECGTQYASMMTTMASSVQTATRDRSVLVGRPSILQGRLNDHFAGSRFGHAEMARDVAADLLRRRDIGGSLLSEVADYQANASEDVIRPHGPSCQRVPGNSIGNHPRPSWAFPERLSAIEGARTA